MQVTYVKVVGRVQGVWFRDYTRGQALELNLTGWVRNVSDGSVEAILCGRKEDVSSMLDRLREGSPNSRVDEILVEEQQSDEHFSTFEIRY